MDFSTLDLGQSAVARTETAASIEPKGGDGKPVKLANGEKLRFDLLLPTTPEGQREIRKWGLKSGVGREAKDLTDADEAELDAAVERDMASEVDLASRIVRGWNLIDNAGKAVECSLDNRRSFFSHFAALRADTITQMGEKSEALGNSRKG